MVNIGPVEDGIKGLQFIDEVKGAAYPGSIFPRFRKVSVKPCRTAPLAGYPIESLKVVLLDGSYHIVSIPTACLSRLLPGRR
jgi:elongation factor G